MLIFLHMLSFPFHISNHKWLVCLLHTRYYCCSTYLCCVAMNMATVFCGIKLSWCATSSVHLLRYLTTSSALTSLYPCLRKMTSSHIIIPLLIEIVYSPNLKVSISFRGGMIKDEPLVCKYVLYKKYCCHTLSRSLNY